MKNILLLFIAVVTASSAVAQKGNAIPEIGVVQNIENDSVLQHQGYKFLIESVGNLISPRTVSDEQFQTNLKKIKSSRVPLYAFNIFIPGELKVVGPEVNEEAVLQYVEKVMQRVQKANVNKIIWGSGGSRRVPEGFDPSKAKEQFISIAKKVAVMAARYNITVCLENLNSTETNFINRVEESLDIVKQVNHKNLRLCVDIYHMLKDSEPPAIIEKTKGFVVYCEVAEKEGRTPPGVQGDDFRPYFAALKKADYHGNIMIECRWQDVVTQGTPALKSLRGQITDVYEKKQ